MLKMNNGEYRHDNATRKFPNIIFAMLRLPFLRDQFYKYN